MDIIGIIKKVTRSLFESVTIRRVRKPAGVHTFRPSVESLEERVTPSNYYWRPQNRLAIDVSTAGNWQNSNGVPYVVAPGINDTLFFDAAAFNCTFDANAS